MSYSAVTYEFSSVEQQEQVTHSLDWPVEYRQLKPGSFSSTFRALEGSAWFLLEEQSNCTVEVAGGAPDDMFVLALIEGKPIAISGQLMTESAVYVQTPGSSFSARLPAGVRITQLGISTERLMGLVELYRPRCRFPADGVSVLVSDEDRLHRLRSRMWQALYVASPRSATYDEVICRILAEFVEIAAGQCNESSVVRTLRATAATRSLNRAREYIEAHIADKILVPALCEYAGTTLRSLERIFSRELETSPQQYIKARRLNATRRQLLILSPDEGIGVTEVAQNFGFSHMGRFAGDYRRYFGESPHETLQNR